VDYYRDSGNPVAARLFRPEHKSKDSTNRWLDTYFDRYRRHTRCIEPVGGGVDLPSVENRSGSQTGYRSYNMVTKMARLMQSENIRKSNFRIEGRRP
jgi:hypothetical protein